MNIFKTLKEVNLQITGFQNTSHIGRGNAK
jgi:hypothetical protein